MKPTKYIGKKFLEKTVVRYTEDHIPGDYYVGCECEHCSEERAKFYEYPKQRCDHCGKKFHIGMSFYRRNILQEYCDMFCEEDSKK